MVNESIVVSLVCRAVGGALADGSPGGSEDLLWYGFTHAGTAVCCFRCSHRDYSSGYGRPVCISACFTTTLVRTTHNA